MRLFLIVATACVCSSSCDAAESILRQTFTKGVEGWMSMGQPSKLDAVDGELNFRYTAAVKGMSVAFLPVKNLPVAEMRSIRFEVKTDSAFGIGVVLSEKKPGGGNYTAIVWSNGSEWQPIVLRPGNFTGGEGPDEPVDSDGKLDVDQVQAIGLIDVSQIFGRLSRADSPVYAEAHSGEHTISIRNFDLSRDAASSEAQPNMSIEDFAQPQVGWMALGSARITGKEGAMSIEYEQQAEHAVAFLHSIAGADFRGATHIAFDVSSSKAAQYVLSIQEARHHKAGEASRYNVDFFVPAGRELQHREIALTAFMADQNAPADPDGQLDLNDLRSLTVLDASEASGRNTLTIHDLKFVKR